MMASGVRVARSVRGTTKERRGDDATVCGCRREVAETGRLARGSVKSGPRDSNVCR